MSRYQVESHWRKPNGDWVGVLGSVPYDYSLWHFVTDTDDSADNWSDQHIAETKDIDLCRQACTLLNKIDSISIHDIGE